MIKKIIDFIYIEFLYINVHLNQNTLLKLIFIKNFEYCLKNIIIKNFKYCLKNNKLCKKYQIKKIIKQIIKKNNY